MPKKTKGLFKIGCMITVFMLLACASYAQNAVTGKILNKTDNTPVPGATIQVKGTKVLAQSGADGTFSISLPGASGTLIITGVGFQDLEVPSTAGAAAGNIVLSVVATSLNDVVVTGYTAQRKKDITGSVSVVNVADMKQSPVGTGEEALQGRASGVTIITSGSPGGQSDIRIRGITAFGINSPLIIVDGVRSSLHDINTNDIESMQVLKDASAAIYGVAGSNGVIIITTKKGKTGRAKVSYDGFVGVTQRGHGV